MSNNGLPWLAIVVNGPTSIPGWMVCDSVPIGNLIHNGHTTMPYTFRLRVSLFNIVPIRENIIYDCIQRFSTSTRCTLGVLKHCHSITDMFIFADIVTLVNTFSLIYKHSNLKTTGSLS